jgi:hypothetical protein
MKSILVKCDYKTFPYMDNCLGVELDKGQDTVSLIKDIIDFILEQEDGEEEQVEMLFVFRQALSSMVQKEDTLDGSKIFYFPDIDY